MNPDTESPNRPPASVSDSPDDTSPDQNNDPTPVQPPATGWSYRQTSGPSVIDDDQTPSKTTDSLPEHVSWTAPEYQEYSKGLGWFAAATAVGIAVSALTYLVTRDFVSTGVIAVVTVIFLISAAHRPGTLECEISSRGLQIGGKLRPFAHYKAFTVSEDEDAMSFTLLPLKRFTPLLTVIFPREKFDQVTTLLQDRLPFQPVISDPVDNLARRLRF